MSTSKASQIAMTDIKFSGETKSSPRVLGETVNETGENIDNEDVCFDNDAASETSTIIYEHEPFESFQYKVAQLASYIFPGSEVNIQRMKGGSFNRVVGITTTTGGKIKNNYKRRIRNGIQRLFRANSDQLNTKQYVARIPRCDDDDMEKDVATLEAIRGRFRFAVPQVTKCDLSANNILQNAYMIQPRIPGQTIKETWPTLNMKQKKSLAKRIIELSSEIATFTSSSAGTIAARDIQDGESSSIAISQFHVQNESPLSSPIESCLELLLRQCKRWSQYQMSSRRHCYQEIWVAYAKISKSLQARGFLEESFCFVHGDLLPHNLLIAIRDSSTVEVTGVVDWDSGYFGPRFMAYRAPYWLWLTDDDDEWVEGNVNMEPKTEEDREMKAVFDEVTSQDFKRLACSPEAILARRMFKILKDGMFDDWTLAEAYAVINDWETLYPEDNVKAEMQSNSSDEEDSSDEEIDEGPDVFDEENRGYLASLFG
ncbi:hypothetical protein BDV95DRAFT_591494 [Massariosphaeria phaeospora]|uniref:Aminoglycoside phosphotransferase domain-containing protein n=1 Tax=Massariosphaeria phaeospora TaxID=100035 RepID=A0A7C8MCE1_9PLEO|nr:hypothetical protein BDV95DRAFT_591494 [Massariosphaeria phaeospora]